MNKMMHPNALKVRIKLLKINTHISDALFIEAAAAFTLRKYIPWYLIHL